MTKWSPTWIATIDSIAHQWISSSLFPSAINTQPFCALSLYSYNTHLLYIYTIYLLSYTLLYTTHKVLTMLRIDQQFRCLPPSTSIKPVKSMSSSHLPSHRLGTESLLDLFQQILRTFLILNETTTFDSLWYYHCEWIHNLIVVFAFSFFLPLIKLTAHDDSSFQRKYKIRNILGKGGFGTVYDGIRIRDNLPVSDLLILSLRASLPLDLSPNLS